MTAMTAATACAVDAIKRAERGIISALCVLGTDLSARFEFARFR